MTKHRIADLIVDKLAINGVDVVTALLLASGQVADLNGESYGLILDADADTAIGAPTDDVINIKINGAEDFRLLANIFRALSGSVIETDTINETTSATGVTIDSLLVKDAGLVVGTSGALDLNGEAGGIVFDTDGDTKLYASANDVLTLKIAGASDFTLAANLLTALAGSVMATDTISETTAANGVDIDGLKVKDNTLTAWRYAVVTKSGNYTVTAADSGTIFIAGAADIVFTLPATIAGLRYGFVIATAGLSAGTGLSVSPAAADKIMGNGFTSADNKDAICAGSGDREGDQIRIFADGVDGWYFDGPALGTWTREA
jgi:hypothetical protein